MRLLVPMLVALTAGSACRPASEAADSPHAPYRGPLASSLQVEVLGDSARLVLHVTNAAEAPVTITFPSGQSYDFSVREGERVLWTWSADRSFLQAVRMEPLAAGETRTFAEVWRPQAALRGRSLTAEGRLTSSDHPLQQTAEFRLP